MSPEGSSEVSIMFIVHGTKRKQLLKALYNAFSVKVRKTKHGSINP